MDLDEELPVGAPETEASARLRRTIEEQARRIAELERENGALRGSGGRPATTGWRTTPAERDVLFSAAEKTRMPMIVTDPNLPDDPIVFANRAFQDLSGYGVDELVGRNCRFLQGQGTDRAHVDEIKRGLAERRDVTVDIVNYRKDSTPFVNELYISPVVDADGRVLYHFGSQVDVTQAKRNVELLRASEQRQRAFFQSAVDFAFVVTDLEGVVTDWNRGAERVLGWTADEIVGEAIERIFTPEDVAAGRPREEMEEAVDDGSAPDERWHMRKDGSRFYASGKLMPLVTDDGRRTGFLKMMVDRTEQHVQAADLEASRRDLETSEAKWRGLFENLREGFIVGRVIRDADGCIVDWRYEEVNRAWGELVGSASERAAGRTIRELFPGIEDAWVAEFADVVRTGEAIHFTRQVGDLGRWYDGVCQPAGEDRFTVIFLEVTDRVVAERRLAELDERRRLATDVGEVGLWELDLATGELTLDARMRAMNGVTGPDLDAAGAFAAVHPDDRTRLDVELRRLPAGGTERLSIEYRVIGIEDAVVRTVHVNATAVRGEDGTATRLVGASRDVSDRVAADERRIVLNRELAHRLKNTLAMVQSIATQTLRVSPNMATARATLMERIGVLSRAHDILITGQRDAASVGDIVKASTALLADGDRIHAAGPDVPLGPKASLTLSLILHELSTNAGKYGALSTPEGRVDVDWSVADDVENRRPTLSFEWREVGGPPVTPPTRRSFGSRLIEMGLSGAAERSSELVYAPDGIVCRLTASLTELQTDEGTHA